MPEFDDNESVSLGMMMYNHHTKQTERLSKQHAQLAMMAASDEEYDSITEWAQLMTYLGLYPCVRLALKEDEGGDARLEYQLGVWTGKVVKGD